MRAVDIVLKKRDGGELSREELEFLVAGHVLGTIPEYQVSAFLMAVFFRGMSPAETAVLTDTMLRSGATMDLSGIPGPFVDKHSTGGVGDKISLVLAPVVAACGARVPMMSGRALGHTGGTLDKLESIPGYRTGLSNREFREGLLSEGYAMTGQTADMVPSDKKLYALRDVTGTVESIPLITASILSKKIAEGTESLVLDVKSGPGAFMKSVGDARSLARSLVDTGVALGRSVVALLTDMSEPIGMKVGNFLEVEESLDCLEGHGPPDTMELTLRLAEVMLVLSGACGTTLEAGQRARDAIASGKALELFLANARRQGGDVERMLAMRGSFRSPHWFDIQAGNEGWIESIDAFAIGRAGTVIGVGRNIAGDSVRPDVGFIFRKRRGDRVRQGETLARVFGKDERSLEAVRETCTKAFVVGSALPAPKKIIVEEIGLS